MDGVSSINKFSVPLIAFLLIFISSSCGLILPPAPQPQLSATDFPPRVTALSELPPTWTPVPSSNPSPTIPPSPSPLPRKDPDNYQIELVMTPVTAVYPLDPVGRFGWKRLEGETAAIFIPPSYEVLDLGGVFLDLMFGVMEAFLGSFTEMAFEMREEMGSSPQVAPDPADLKGIPETDFLIAVEEVSQSAIILTSLDIAPTATTENLLNRVLTNTDTDFVLRIRQIYQDGPFPMERVILDVKDEELGSGKQIIYVILGDQIAWNVIFTTPADQFEQNLPLFESAINSFTVK